MEIRRAIAWLALLLCNACAQAPDEERIRSAISAMEEAVEERKPRDFINYLAADFSGGESSLDREQLHNILRAQLLRNEKIGIIIGPIDVDLRGERATAEFSATLSGGSGWLPERGAIYTFSTGWKREDGDWHCINATWESQ